MTSKESRYIPALSFRWLTPLYDPLLKWGMREETFKRRLIERSGIRDGQHVLDLGCGTGTLTVMVKRAYPKADVTGLDGDPDVLEIARSKARQARLEITWDHGYAYDLTYPDRSFDVVISSLVVHHLNTQDKLRAFQETRRILRPGGRFHIIDFGKPYSLLTHLQASIMKNLEEVADNFAGRIAPLLQQAGFESVSEAEKFTTVFGPVWFYQAIKSKG